MSYNIPIEIQTEIMKRLPVKSVIQFRSVSKEWKSLIDSSDFIAHYRGQHQHLLVSYYDNAINRNYVLIADDHTFPFSKVSPTLPLSVKLLRRSRIIGSSHGLFCLYGTEQHAFLCNPSVRKAVGDVVRNRADNEIYGTVLGFGVYNETNDIKIVKITYIRRWKDMETISSIPWQVEVFTLSTRDWRSLYSSNLPRKSIHFSMYFHTYSADVDGILYWLATDRITMDGEFRSYKLILSFDMISEEFREINLPHSLCLLQCFNDLSIFKLRESLVVIESNVLASNPVFSIWTMGDGVPKSFTKLFSVNVNTPAAIVWRFMGFRKTGELILEILDDDPRKKLVVYEPCSKTTNKLGVPWPLYVCPYMETLLLLEYLISLI